MRIFLSILLISFIIGCEQKPDANQPMEPAPIDALVKNWVDNWNNHDSLAVRNMFDTNAVLIDDNVVANNVQELSDKWIHPNILLVNKLTANKIKDWQDKESAGYSGFYELDVMINNLIMAHPKGVFTINWKKNSGGNWKIISAHIHSFTERK